MKRYEQQYNVGIYCRLSKDDIGSGYSSSILSQKEILEKYVRENGWAIFDSYIDDGYSGTNFQRPSFQRMIDDVESGKINLVLCKDLSRLGRNYIMTGQYTEIYFPDRGVRFIALTDGIDTINSDNDIAPFKNILNEMFSKDISRKIRAVVRSKKQSGKYLSNYAPFGYAKDPLNKNKLIIEEKGAVVVQRIYDMCGSGCPTIAKALNKDGIPTPRNHREAIYPSHSKTPQRKYEWTPETVHNILRSCIYKGDMIQGVYDCARFKRTPTKRKPAEDWFITPNTHEPIINEELWNYVQKCLNSRKRVRRNNELQLFSGFIKCADCGYALACAGKGSTEYYSCGLYRRKGTEHCSQHYINKKVLINAVLDDIRRHAKMAAENAEGFALRLAELNGDSEEKQIQALSAEIKAAETRCNEIDRIMEQLYEDKLSGSINEARFQKFSDKYETEQSAAEKKIKSAKAEIERLRANKHDTSTWLELIKNYAYIRELDRIILGELVEKITVGETKIIDGVKNIEITIYYRFVGAVNF